MMLSNLTISLLVLLLAAMAFMVVERIVDRRLERRVRRQDSLDAPVPRREVLELELRVAHLEDRLSRWDPMTPEDIDVTAGWRDRETSRRGRGNQPPRHWRRGIRRHQSKKARQRR